MYKPLFRTIKATIVAVQAMDATAGKVLPEDIEKIVKIHARLAVASSFIPIGGLDVAAATVNVWTMYVRINSALGIQFSDNKMKSIGSAVVANLVQNLGVTFLASTLKYIPGGIIVATGIMASALYALTITSAWVYLKALANMALNDGDIEKSVKETLKDKADIKKIYNENK